ncbi:MAG: tandem-95 repeat protein [Actinobacteria bacterium]|nr:tandem-95 repeat protein [Actinomycetota bacterium]
MSEQLGKLVRIAVCIALMGVLIPGFAIASEAAEVPKVPGPVTPPPGTIGEAIAIEGGAAAAQSPAPLPEGSPSILQPSPTGGDKAAAVADSYVDGQVLVCFVSGLSAASIASANNSVGGITVASYSLVSGLKLVQLMPGVSVEDAVARYKNMPGVAYAEPNRLVQIAAVDPNDTLYGDQWALKNTGQTGGTPDADIDADEAWSFDTGSAGVVVGVIDTGVDTGRPDLVNNLWVNTGEIPGNWIDDDLNGYIDDVNGWDTYGNSSTVDDDNGHGTHVAGIIGAEGNNALGVSGVNWDVSIAAIRAFAPDGSANMADVIAALQYADLMNFPIVNCSWGHTGTDLAEESAIAAMDALVVCAAGNSASDNDGLDPYYPASYNLANVLAVGATGSSDAASANSNFGVTSVDLFAPGEDILSTTPGLATLDRTGDAEIYRDDFDSLGDWVARPSNTGGLAWVLTSQFAWSPSTSMAFPDYGNSQSVYMQKATPLDLTGLSSPYLHFRVGYSLEDGFDYASWGIYDAGTASYFEMSSMSETGYHGPFWSKDAIVDLTPWVGHNDIYPYFGIETDLSVSPADGYAGYYYGPWVDDLTVVDGVYYYPFDTPDGWSVYTNYWAPYTWNWDPTNGTNGDPARYGCWRAAPYANSEWTSLTQAVPMNLSGASSPALDFWTYYNTEGGYDFFWVQVSTDGGTGWNTLARWDGWSGGWSHRTLSLAPYVGSPDVRIRFVLTTDSSVIYQGVWVDDVRVTVTGVATGPWTAGTTYSHSYAEMTGTSAAAPFASGVAALLLSRYPGMTVPALKTAIMDSAEPVTGLSGLCVTGARLNAMSAFALTNAAPVAVNDSFSCDEDSSIVGNVMGNDTDAEGDPLTALLDTGPANGALVFGADGSFTYTPNANWNGVDSLTYHVNDGMADSAVATATLTVNPVNDVPVAVDDTAACDEDTSAVINVLANDSDIDLDPLTPVKQSDPANGTAVLNADKTFTYTPNANWHGVDSFTYLANDGIADSNTVTVTITVPNTVPPAADDSYNVPTNGLKRVHPPGVMANDGDYLGDGLSVFLVSGPAHGFLTLHPDGSFLYVPDANYVGVDSFTYQATDGLLNTNVATVALVVTPFGPPIDGEPGVVYRFYNMLTATHFYTSSLQERNNVILQYQGVFSYEGAAFWSFPSSGTIPVHRFYNRFSKSHFFTASDDEKAKVEAFWPYIFTYEGRAFDVYTAPGVGRAPVYRFYNYRNGSHFYTPSLKERANVIAKWPDIYREEGVAFYILDGSL